MIEKIRGTVSKKSGSNVIIMISGIGLSVSIPERAAQTLLEGEEILLFTKLLWRQNGPELFGFLNDQDISLFCRLYKISGIGPKAILSLISELGHDKIAEAIMTSNASALASVPGVGKKTAGRIISEAGGTVKIDKNEEQGVVEAIHAIMNMGHLKTEATSMITTAKNQCIKPFKTEDLVREALRSLI